ncbi:hypothetical protein VV02_10535 [Luteipulveratus mongoliensis]|uniref:NADP-dependent oxidoreductase domain-containing protein n=2 Tax=Luteipulveratus mongoliensis TaxID=571913 RepID=A0A0K1JQJ2_9MICO|nr:hypothetical protein VV02_10535 [Luteipulveratus mongoliensis]
MAVAGMPLIELVARRASRSGHEVVVATSDEHYDTRIAEHLEHVGIRVVRGALDDVLGRFVQATEDLDPTDRVVRLTGDNPVMDADVVDELLAAMDESGHAYGRVDIDVVPEGLGAEGFWVGDLRRASESTQDPYDREHVTPWLRRTLGELLFAPKANPGEPARYRCTVDNLSDFDRVSRLFAHVEDPVAVPWTDFMDALSGDIAEQGPTVRTRDTSELRQSAFVVGGAHLSGDHAPDAAEVRTLLDTAVVRGVTHVEVGRADGRAERVLRAGIEPQLTRRLGYISRLRPLEAGEALAVEASLERTFAELGRRSVAAAVLAGPGDAGDKAWARLRKYHATGEVGRLGVSVSSLDEVPKALALGEIGYLEMPFNVLQALPEETERALRSAKVVVATYRTYDGGALLADHPAAKVLASLADDLGRDGVDDLCLAYVLGHDVITSAVIGCHSDQEVRRNADLAAREPLSPAEVQQVHDALSKVRA